jgi:hypothetical protein
MATVGRKQSEDNVAERSEGLIRQGLEAVMAGMAAGTILAFGVSSLGQPGPQANAPASARGRSLSFTTGGLVLGGLAGLLHAGLGNAGRRRRSQDAPTPAAFDNTWTSWREFVVSQKQAESAEITSFELQPLDGEPLPAFKPGQFLTIELHIPGQARPVLRTYSLSDYPPLGQPIKHYRLSIKREPAPKGQNVPQGLASNFLHDHVSQGSTLRVRRPAGSFVLDTSSSKPIVLISNGVGITPMIAMAKAALGQPSPRPIWFLHGCRNGPFHAFRDELASLAAAHSNLHRHIAYSRPNEEDAGHYQSEGYVDWALVRSLVDQDADYFLCGSPPFMQGLIAELRQAGIPETAIHFEMFSSRPPASSSTSEAAAEASSMADATLASSEVTFARSGLTATWASTDPEDTLLALAETQGLEPAFACRAGVCGTCACRVLEGEVSYISEATAAVTSGSALICIAKPQGAIVKLDL